MCRTGAASEPGLGTIVPCFVHCGHLSDIYCVQKETFLASVGWEINVCAISFLYFSKTDYAKSFQEQRDP